MVRVPVWTPQRARARRTRAPARQSSPAVATSSVSPPDPERETEDAKLPDPSRTSMAWAAAFFAAAVGLALLADLTNLDKDPPFDPKSVPGGGIAIFAGFAVSVASGLYLADTIGLSL